jgi:hypothetical protein
MKSSAPILAALFAQHYRAEEHQMTLPSQKLVFFYSQDCNFVAMNMPQGPFQPLHANGIRNGGFGAVRSMAAYMRSMFRRLGASDSRSCRLSRNEAVMARQI